MTDPTNTDPAADDTAATVVEPWYCDQCGAHYAGPGICENQHAPTELVELAPDAAADAAAETGQDPAPVAEPAPAVAADETEPAAAVVELPDTINIGTTVQTTIGDTAYNGSISVSLTKQTPTAS